jgi:hypothetical protein
MQSNFQKIKELGDWTYICTVKYAALFKGPEKKEKRKLS